MSLKDNKAETFERNLAAFVRAFGLHQNEQTPCGIHVTVSEAHALVEIRKNQGLSQTDLTNFLKLEKSSVSRLVKGLTQKGWLEKSKHPHDNRAYLLTLTNEGNQKAEAIANARQVKFQAILNKLTETQSKTVINAFEILTEVLNENNP